ncbi:mediator of rna polymerase ii transcription subunit 11-like [Plasmopara halstedii]|uniref:Mediator of RNA polymerase II transcription subunit 11 n=1 Tax=Plasmopara halstedii TaxID=4781 RepID=A0A0P1AJK8_PLAHL|nr:mediator of rna polymerase ii transcription subunit 11-like [Plasmopara halstedii]CEG40749.1 mediator of rna polymerase ii transcription subunit 11-like [Plasmopara halstedii]|eukprot:XP_024577118.1 mediator of rna polymerase ii transcription subunit 11-like [Plasmopara halstedii]
METEGDSRVHFSEVSDPWSSSRHVAVLQALDAVEKKLVTALRTAAAAMSLMAPRVSSDESASLSFNSACTEFLQLIKEIHTELANNIHLVSDYRTFARSTYGAEKSMEIGREKVKIVVEQLQTLSRFLEDHCYTPEECS